MDKKYRNWTTNEDIKLEELLEKKVYSFAKINEILHRTGSQDRARRLGLKSSFIYKIYSCNESFWSDINENTCYWAGFSAADASIQQNKLGHFSYSLELQIGDINHLEKLKESCNFSGSIKEYLRPKGSKTCRIRIHSNKWAADLQKNFGISTHKTKTIMPPNIDDKKMLILWLIGYTDGDGCIHYHKKGGYPSIKYCSSNENLVRWIKQFFDAFGKKLRCKENNIRSKNGKYYELTISGIKAAQFINYVNSLSVFCMKRKWQNPQILKSVEDYKRKYPEYF